MNRMALSSVVILLLAATACGGNESPPKAPEPPPASTVTAPTTMSGTTTTTTPGTTREGNPTLASSNTNPSGAQTSSSTPSSARTAAGPMEGSSTSNAPTRLTDEQILYVLHAANIAEMDQARVAQKSAKSPRVKRFAEMMIKDHGDADARGTDVAKKMNASLTPSDVSNRLETDAKQMSVAISAEKGTKDFDRTYIDAQVKEHRALLDAIDRELLPAVQTPAVKDLVQNVRPKVDDHLREASDIMKGMK